MTFCFFNGHYEGLSPKLWSNGEAPVPQKTDEIDHKRADCDRGTGSRENGADELVGDMGSEPRAAFFDSKIAGRCLAFSVSPHRGLATKGAGRYHAPARLTGPSPPAPTQPCFPRKQAWPGNRCPLRREPGTKRGDSRGTSLPQDEVGSGVPGTGGGVTVGVTGECSL